MIRVVPVLRAVLCGYLLLWEPLNVASETLRVWPTLAARGPWAFVELAVHVVFALVAIAGGISLWNRSPHGVIVAALGVFASTARALQVNRFSMLPHDSSPDAADVLAWIALANGLLWTMFLTRYQHQLADHRA